MGGFFFTRENSEAFFSLNGVEGFHTDCIFFSLLSYVGVFCAIGSYILDLQYTESSLYMSSLRLGK